MVLVNLPSFPNITSSTKNGIKSEIGTEITTEIIAITLAKTMLFL